MDESACFFSHRPLGLMLFRGIIPSLFSQDTHTKKETERTTQSKRSEFYPPAKGCARRGPLSVLILSGRLIDGGRGRAVLLLFYASWAAATGSAHHHFWPILGILEHTQHRFALCRSKKESKDSYAAVLYASSLPCCLFGKNSLFTPFQPPPSLDKINMREERGSMWLKGELSARCFFGVM